MTKPVQDTSWALANIAEYAVNDQNQSVLVPNKTEPSTSYKQSGARVRSPLFRNYVNYAFNAIHLWITWLNEGEVGDYKVMPSGTSVATVEARFGGTWVDIGSDTIATETIQLFKKTA